MRFIRLLQPVLFAGAMLAQAPSELFEKAPPHIDEALRASITHFYQAHVDGKFRLADKVVAEDSKDAFFIADKTQYRGFEIVRITYSDSFTRAKAVVSCDMDFFIPGAGKRPVKIPLTTLWKQVNGEWFWYVEPNAPKETPFGQMKTQQGAEDSSPLAQMPLAPDVVAIQRQVRVSKTEVRLSSYEPASDEVVISNGMPGTVTLALQTESLKGFEATLDRTELNAGETARIAFRCTPADKSPKPALTATLSIQPINQVIPIRITFAVPPEVEKVLPK